MEDPLATIKHSEVPGGHELVRSDGRGHTALVVGYTDTTWLKVYDPWIGEGWWTMMEVVQVYGYQVTNGQLYNIEK